MGIRNLNRHKDKKKREEEEDNGAAAAARARLIGMEIRERKGSLHVGRKEEGVESFSRLEERLSDFHTRRVSSYFDCGGDDSVFSRYRRGDDTFRKFGHIYRRF